MYFELASRLLPPFSRRDEPGADDYVRERHASEGLGIGSVMPRQVCKNDKTSKGVKILGVYTSDCQ